MGIGEPSCPAVLSTPVAARPAMSAATRTARRPKKCPAARIRRTRRWIVSHGVFLCREPIWKAVDAASQSASISKFDNVKQSAKRYSSAQSPRPEVANPIPVIESNLAGQAPWASFRACLHSRSTSPLWRCWQGSWFRRCSPEHRRRRILFQQRRTERVTSAGSLTSAVTVIASPPAALILLATVKLCSRAPLVILAPKPREAPVKNQTFDRPCSAPL